MRMFSFFSKGKSRDIEDNEYARDFDVEFAKDTNLMNNSNLADPNNSYSHSGVHMTTLRGNGKLTYDGLLVNSGADGVYVAIGFGDKWDNTQYFPMSKTKTQAFEVQFPITSTDSINIAFKDSASNWDNNNGMNYTFSNSKR